MKNLSTKLQRLGIGDLRVLGRLVGSPGPTTMSRDELIGAILALAEGKADPVTIVPGSAKGKPPRARKVSAELSALAEEIKTMILLNRPFRAQLGRDSLVRLCRSDSLFESLAAPEAERVRAGYLFRAESGTWFLFDARFRPLLTLSDRDAEWQRYRLGTYLFVSARDGEADVWSVDGTAAAAYRYPLAWKPLTGVYARQRVVTLGGRDCPLGRKILWRGAAPVRDLEDFLTDGLSGVMLGLHFGLSAVPEILFCEICTVRSAEEIEKIDFTAARAARLAERGLDVLLVLTGLQDAQDETLMRKKLFPLAGIGAAGGTIAVLAVTEYPISREGFDEIL